MKIKELLICSAIACMAVSCASVKPVEESEKPSLLEKKFTRHSIDIQLEGNPTTGYSWKYEISDSKIVSVKESIEYQGKDGVTGAPSIYTYTVTGLKAGIAEISFKYLRFWESETPAQVKKVKITVHEDGSLDQQ